MKYSASLSTTAKLVTGIFIFIVFLSSILTFVASDGAPLAMGLITLLALIVVGTYMYSVRGYSLETDTLDVQRPIGAHSTFYSDITSVQVLGPEDTKGLIRTFGNGGLWGFTGHFYNKKLGNIRLYATHIQPSLLVYRSSGKPLLLSPDDAEGMARELESRVSQ